MNLRTVVGLCTTRLSTLRRIAPKLLTVAMMACVSLSSLFAAEPVDWFQWRGPEGNGISREKNLPTTWSPKGENLIWSNDNYGTRSTPIAMNGKIYVVTRYKPETTEEGESVLCIDANTGELIWEHHHNVFLTDSPAERVGWASVVGDPSTGNIYWLGQSCEFVCLDGQTGESLWNHSMSEEYGMLSTYGGRTNFPIVFEDLVIVSGVMTQWGENAVPAHRFVGFQKETGAAVWFSGTTPKPFDTTYSTPFLTTFNGQAAIVFGSGDGKVHAMQPRTGKLIWSYAASNRGVFTTPVVVDNIVYCGFNEQSSANTRILGGLFALDGRTEGVIPEDKLLWKIDGVQIGGGQPIVVDGRLYMIDIFGKLLVVDAKTGDIIQEKKVGRLAGNHLVLADGRLYCTTSISLFWVFDLVDEGVKEVSRVRLNNDGDIQAAPIVLNGKIYVTTSDRMYCIGQQGAQVEADPLPTLMDEPAVSVNPEIAHIQLAPVEAMLAPGQTARYRVRGYNSLGQYVKEVDAEFEVKGGGEMSASGEYTAPEGNQHSAVFLTAKAGDVTSTARARIIPPLPWSFDFNDKQVPITWIGAAYRHQPKELSGESVLVKISTIPLGTRSQSWMGWTTLSNYTVQADVYSTKNESNGERADMGVINQRYTLDLMGSGELQIRSWTSRLENRFAKTIPFQWDSDTWYTLKFQSENKDGKAILRGKVWKRGEEEPADWNIEAADAVPNTSGSPGLFGMATNAEFYIDNVQVYKNEQ